MLGQRVFVWWKVGQVVFLLEGGWVGRVCRERERVFSWLLGRGGEGGKGGDRQVVGWLFQERMSGVCVWGGGGAC